MIVRYITIFLIMLILSIPMSVYAEIPLDNEIQTYISEVSQEYDIDELLILAVIKLESNFDKECISNNYDSSGEVISKDQGLMQINSAFQDWYAELAGLEEYDVMNPYNNVKMGVSGLAFYRDYWSEQGITGGWLMIHVLNSYNMGLEGYKRHKAKNDYRRAYDKIVFKHMYKINKIK